MRDAEEVGQATSVRSFSDAGAAEEHPLHAPLARIFAQRKRAERRGVVRRRVAVDYGGAQAPPRQGRDDERALREAGYGRHDDGICRLALNDQRQR